VKDDLVLRLRVVNLSVLGPGTCALRGHGVMRFFHPPSVLGQVVPLFSSEFRLGSVQLNCDVQGEATDVDLVVLKGDILIGSCIFDILQQSPVSQEIYSRISIGYARDVPHGLVDPLR
jgi:hypothetical protein